MLIRRVNTEQVMPFMWNPKQCKTMWCPGLGEVCSNTVNEIREANQPHCGYVGQYNHRLENRVLVRAYFFSWIVCTQVLLQWFILGLRYKYIPLYISLPPSPSLSLSLSLPFSSPFSSSFLPTSPELNRPSYIITSIIGFVCSNIFTFPNNCTSPRNKPLQPNNNNNKETHASLLRWSADRKSAPNLSRKLLLSRSVRRRVFPWRSLARSIQSLELTTQSSNL